MGRWFDSHFARFGSFPGGRRFDSHKSRLTYAPFSLALALTLSLAPSKSQTSIRSLTSRSRTAAQLFREERLHCASIGQIGLPPAPRQSRRRRRCTRLWRLQVTQSALEASLVPRRLTAQSRPGNVSSAATCFRAKRSPSTLQLHRSYL